LSIKRIKRISQQRNQLKIERNIWWWLIHCKSEDLSKNCVQA
jgi:hypothetical protein